MSGAGEDDLDLWAQLDPKSGERIWRTNLTAASDTQAKNLYVKSPAVIPIVFLPGIMGTNLKTRGQTNVAWRPPNTVAGKISSAFTWMWRGPKTRQIMLDMRAVEVDSDGPIRTGDSGLSEALAKQRGWGSVMASSYHPVMALMQKSLNAIASFNAGTPMKSPRAGATVRNDWKKSGMIPPAEYGEQFGLPALTEAELIRAAHYLFPVWCAGYNWLQSNFTSGADVKNYIENTVLAHYREKNIPAKKVILVTHSMGGLVGRSLTELHKYKNVLGVVNGVQPATGAPAFYHHARCGYEGAEQVVLGRNAGEVVAVIGNAPGALELAPTFDHDNGKPWLFLHDTKTNKVTRLPSGKNPYAEIYTNPAWYGLVPQENSRYLDLSKKSSGPETSSRGPFVKNVTDVATFHKKIAGKYFSPTYAHYGAESTRHSWESIEWHGDLSLIGKGYQDDENGTYSNTQGSSGGMGYSVTYTLKGPELKPGSRQGGDGTVPETSGLAPGAAGVKAGVKASFRHGNMGKGGHNTQKGYDHQSSYLDQRAQWATLYSIIKIAQAADWHE
ncbi:MAG: hypothetical protein QM599_12470 [Pseudoxanthomonas sp.]